MVKKYLPLILVLLLFAFSISYGARSDEETQPRIFSAEEISDFEKKFKEIDVYMEYFREKMVEHNDIIDVYTDAERLFRDLKTSPDIVDIELAREHLNTKLENLREKAEQRMSYIKRMDLMYQTMTILGLVIIVFMVVYSIYMFARRKV
ncbi:MAG TPA: hypothetical protein PK358_07835 [Spirochaetota bacterium]|nr:hypothetical protein [Spirochaetota bacterium]HPJ34730.1 hypothetical protein [Spirochaetota bacterium]